MLDEYNASLPSKEVPKKYKDESSYFEYVKEHPFDIELEIDNDGDMKARDMRIEFRFRLDSIKCHEKIYSLDLFTYDYLVLNLYSSNMSSKHAMKSAFDQLEKNVD